MRTAGVSERAIEEAMYVGFMFNLMDRLVDALGCDAYSDETARKTASIAYRFGYRMACIPG